MYQTITQETFIKGFADIGREKQFTRDALIAIYQYLEEIENDTGESIEFDPIAICCQFQEYKNLQEYNRDSFHQSFDLHAIPQPVIPIGDWTSAFIVDRG